SNEQEPEQNSENMSTQFNVKTTFDLSEDANFVEFVQNFIDTYVEYSHYQQLTLGSNEPNFINQISNSSLSLTEVEQVYTNNGVDFEVILDYQTMIADLIYQIYITYPEFDNMTEEEASELILAELGEVMISGQVNIDNPYSTNEITPDEIWYCVVESVGLGFVSAIGMKQLKKQGIKVITKAFTKAISRFAGPIGIAIAVADFGFCLYKADREN